MKNWYSQYPPYEGNEPYLYFAFAEADRERVWDIMRLFLERGCRVWYNRGNAEGSEEILRRQDRYMGASLTMLYLSDEACRDPNTKSNILVCQKKSKPIICLDPDSKDRSLAMGLRETIAHIPLYKLKRREDLENAILHAEGFSQDLLGEPVEQEGIGEERVLSRLSLVFCALAVVLAVMVFAGIRKAVSTAADAQNSQDQAALSDQVTISDPVIFDAVKEAVGGGPVTEDAVSQITSLHLERMPESWEDLAFLPSLKDIWIPQEALLGDEPLPEGDYTIKLSGGGA